MTEKSGDNIFTVLKVILIVGGVLAVIYMIKPNSFEAFGVKMETEKEEINKSSETIHRIEGNWEMSFNFERCNNSEIANKELICFYDIRLNQDGNKITGTGHKHSESFDGKITRYSKEFPIKIKGEISRNKLIANFYEQNSFDEVTGKIEVPLENEFIYKASGENCDGNIKLKRKTRKFGDN